MNDAPDLVFQLHETVSPPHCSDVYGDVDTGVDEVVEDLRLLLVMCRLIEEETITPIEVEPLSPTGVERRDVRDDWLPDSRAIKSP